jgi:L-arabinose isomerase
MKKPSVGFLPFYLEFYDKVLPGIRENFRGYINAIMLELEKYDIDVVEAPICRVKAEFSRAVNTFELKEVDAILTLHLAYSPSLESAEVLAATRLPVIILDTTPIYGFGPGQSTDEIMYNHGIHGVQDLCNLLIRNKKSYHLEAGHWQKSNVIDRVASWIRVAALASRIQNARVGRIGNPFHGMGDFYIPDELLKSLVGISTVQWDKSVFSRPDSGKMEDAVNKEIEYDMALYHPEITNEEAYRKTIVVGLDVRNWIEKERLTAFTFNFLDINKESGFETLPFMEAGKSMARGIGYAGEGDVLTAALVGALLTLYPDTTFTEMFCPDWEQDTIFISHMAEMNIKLVSGKVNFIEMEYTYSNVDNPIVAVGRFREGKAVIVNLAPAADNSFILVVAPVHVLECGREDKFEKTVHGWIKPSIPVDEFLKLYSQAGGTHHSALVYGDVAEDMQKLGELMGWKVVTIF